jgi:AcrR family transcriptional regulator
MTPETAARSPRSDARANRERVLVAARECFAESLDAQMQDVARRAGVGVGTVYRHFANKEALQVALALDCIGEMELYARAGLDEADPWAGLERFVWACTEKLSADALSVRTLEGASSRDVDERSAVLTDQITELAERARRAGAVRGDLAAEQVEAILRHLAGAVRGAQRSGFDWRAYVRVVLDGLRAPAAPTA